MAKDYAVMEWDKNATYRLCNEAKGRQTGRLIVWNVVGAENDNPIEEESKKKDIKKNKHLNRCVSIFW